MLSLSNLSPQPGSRKNRKRLGRGEGSGHGKTAGRGHKGAKARSGSKTRLGFEGGQMPMHRRLPKRGFTNIFKKTYSLVQLRDLARFEDGATVDAQSLAEAGLVKTGAGLIKILGNDELAVKLTVSVDKVTAGARQKIEAAGGSVTVQE